MTRKPAPISLATIPASEVLPSPGGPANSRWSAGCARRRAASSMISRCSLSWAWPTNSASRRGRRVISSAASTGSADGRDRRDPGLSSAARLRPPESPRRAHRRRLPRQLAQGQADLVLHGAVGRQAAEGLADLVGAVAEPGQGGPHLGPGGRPGRAPAGCRPARTDAEELDVGAVELDVEPGLELDEQPGRGLLADAGHQHQGVGVVGEHGPLQRRRRVHRQQGQGHRRADAVGADQGLEADPLVHGWESRRGRWRPRGRGCGRGGTPGCPGAPIRARAPAGTSTR